MKLLTKPKAPKKGKVSIHFSFDEGHSIQDIIDGMGGAGADLSKACFAYENDDTYCGYGHSFWFSGKREETDEEFQKKVDQYNQKLSKYNKWYEENKEEIEAEKASREAKLRLKDQKATEVAKRRLVTQKNKLEKELKKLNKIIGEE